MNESQIWSRFDALYSNVVEDEDLYRKRPLLAHYTSLEAVEKILKAGEIWLSNPLFMNDIEELRFGLLRGTSVLKSSHAIRVALGTDSRHAKFSEALDHSMAYFEREHLLDTYVFCMSEHDPADTDGLLSMWRGYGGNGKGAAIIFDTSKITPVPGTPLIVGKVKYGSHQERIAWCEHLAEGAASVINEADIPDDTVHIASAAVFERLKLVALYTKHHGFKEEREWRIVYLSSRDATKRLAANLHYLNGPRGIEPRLRFKIAPMDGVADVSVTLDNVLAAILLGPSASWPMAKATMQRMLDLIGRPQFKDRLIASTIPFRA